MTTLNTTKVSIATGNQINADHVVKLYEALRCDSEFTDNRMLVAPASDDLLGSIADPTRPIVAGDKIIMRDVSETTFGDKIREATVEDFLNDTIGYVPGKNKYPTGLANAGDDNKAYNGSTGALMTYSGARVTGLIPVTAGKSYYLWQSLSEAWYENLQFYNSSGVRLGKQDTAALFTDVGLPFPIRLDSNKTWWFIVPPNVAYVGATVLSCSENKSTFLASIQMEEGSQKTTYEAFSKKMGVSNFNLEITGSNIAKNTIGRNNLDSGLLASAKRNVRVFYDGTYVFVRTPFSTEYDLVQVFSIGNYILQPNYVLLTPVKYGTSTALFGASGNKIIQYGADDYPSIFVNGSYMGANHGVAAVREVTFSSAHGLSYSDIGSYVRDGASIPWYLIKIGDMATGANPTTKACYMQTPTMAGDVWTFGTTLTGNLGALPSVSSSSLVQLKPSVKNVTNSILMDGVETPASNNEYYCEYLDIITYEEIVDPADELEIIKAGGFSANPTFLESAKIMFKMKTVWRFSESGICANWTDILANQEMNVDEVFGTLQNIPNSSLISGTYSSMKCYFPDVDATASPSANKNLTTFTTLPAKSIASADLIDPAIPANRFMQFFLSSSTLKVGSVHGYNLLHGMGTNAYRLANCTDFWKLTTTKSDGHCLDAKHTANIQAGEILSMACYRGWFDPTLSLQKTSSNSTAFYWYRDGNSYIVYVDYHAAVTNDIIALPQYMRGMTVSTIQKTSSITVNSDTVGAFGLSFSASGYGYAIIKLT